MTMPFLYTSVEGGSIRIIAEGAWVMMIISGATLSSQITHRVFPNLLSDCCFPLFLSFPIHFSSALLRHPQWDLTEIVVRTLSSENRGDVLLCLSLFSASFPPLKNNGSIIYYLAT